MYPRIRLCNKNPKQTFGPTTYRPPYGDLMTLVLISLCSTSFYYKNFIIELNINLTIRHHNTLTNDTSPTTFTLRCSTVDHSKLPCIHPSLIETVDALRFLIQRCSHCVASSIVLHSIR